MTHSMPDKRPPRGMAIASFITGIAAVALGWIPFIFIIRRGRGSRRARVRHPRVAQRSPPRRPGRGFAVTGLVLAPVALVVCVGGFFFTRAVVREFRDFIEPGPHELVVEQPCTLDERTSHGQRHDSQPRRPPARLPHLRRLRRQRRRIEVVDRRCARCRARRHGSVVLVGVRSAAPPSTARSPTCSALPPSASTRASPRGDLWSCLGAPGWTEHSWLAIRGGSVRTNIREYTPPAVSSSV